MTKREIRQKQLEKIAQAIKSRRLALTRGNKKWYSYHLIISLSKTAFNGKAGWLISVRTPTAFEEIGLIRTDASLKRVKLEPLG